MLHGAAMESAPPDRHPESDPPSVESPLGTEALEPPVAPSEMAPDSVPGEPTQSSVTLGAGDDPRGVTPESSNSPEEVTDAVRAETWSAVARGVAVWGLVGFALVVWGRLAFGAALVVPLLSKNQLEMRERVLLIVEMLAGGAAAIGGVAVYLRMRRAELLEAARRMERLGWFVSPLILLPAIPVFMAHKVWFGEHQTLLPIALFGALLAEFFFSRAAASGVTLAELGLSFSLPERGTVVRLVRTRGFLAVVVACALAYGAFMSFYTVRWHHRLGTAIFDLGINNNLIHGALDGRINYSTVIFPDEPIKYWANHVKLGLFLFLPIYAVFQHAETLLIIQSISLGLGAIPLFLFARRRLPEWGAFVIALAYLAYYPMHSANFYEMKEPPTAAAFVLTMVWALDTKRWKTTWAFFFMSLIMREDMPIPLVMIGVVLLCSGYRPRVGAVMAGISAVWFVILRFKIMNDAGAWWFPNMYETLWAQPEKGFRSVIKTLLSNPTFVLRHIFTEKKFWYLMHMMVPVVFLPARRWYLWAAFVPGAILTLLVTDYNPPIMYTFQYVMHWGPYLFLASVLALDAIRKESPDGPSRQFGGIVALGLVSLALTYNYGAFSARDRALASGYKKIVFSWSEKDEELYQDLQALVRAVPKTASVAATEHIGAHFAARKEFYTLRRGLRPADYLVFRKSELKLDKTRQGVKDALTSKKYGVELRRGEFVLLRRGAPTEQNEEVLASLGLKTKAKAQRLEEKVEEGEEHDADSAENSGDSPERAEPEGGGD